MKLSKQFKTIKENWLIVTLLVILVLFINAGSLVTSSFDTRSNFVNSKMAGYDMTYEETALSSYMPYYGDSFAPDINERVKTKYGNLETQVKNGEFETTQTKLKELIKSSNSILLDENVNKYGEESKSYYYGYYTIKVDTNDYNNLVSELKTIGEVQSFSENVNDITGHYEDITINLDTEKTRLERYKELYSEAKDVEDKLTLEDRIFNQERTIEYLEDQIKNINEKVDYSTINFRLKEEKSTFSDVKFIEFKELARNFTESINHLITLLIVIIPWLILLFIIRISWKKFHK